MTLEKDYRLSTTMVKTYISELDNGKSSEVSKTIMGSVLINDEGDILHRLRTEPTRHGEIGFEQLKLLFVT
jgi:hypothetical protein